jgi:hypothetical protein
LTWRTVSKLVASGFVHFQRRGNDRYPLAFSAFSHASVSDRKNGVLSMGRRACRGSRSELIAAAALALGVVVTAGARSAKTIPPNPLMQLRFRARLDP